MKTVLLRAPLLTQSGYGVHSRQAARWLLNKPNIQLTCQVLPWGDTPWFLDASACDGLIGEIMKRSNAGAGPYDVTVQLQLPNEWDPKLGRYNVGISAVVETDKCNPAWVEACNNMQTVIVPSTHAKSVLTASGDVRSRLIVVPEAYAHECALPDEQLPTLPEFSTPFNFLIFGQLTSTNPHSDRKNTFFTLRWLLETFSGDSEVGIVIKTNAGRNTLIDRNAVTVMMNQIVNEVRKGPYPRVHIMHGDMSDLEVAALYRHQQIKALVALTRGEGYGLPILEAAASGLPIIATGWSGHMDFLKHGKFINIFYQLGDVHQSRIDNKIFVNGARWANPNEQDFKKRVAKFRTSPSTPKEWALDLKQKVQELYSLEKIFEAYDAALVEVL